VTAESMETVTADVLLIVYQGTCPVYFKMDTLSAAKANTNISVPVSGGPYNAKLFIWDSVQTMRPLIKPVVL